MVKTPNSGREETISGEARGARRAGFPVPKSEEGQIRETVNTSPEPPRSARRNENDASEKGSKGKTVKLGGDKQGNQPLVDPRIRTRFRTEKHRRFSFQKKKDMDKDEHKQNVLFNGEK